MNPYHRLVAEYARLSREGKSYPLGEFAKNPSTVIASPGPCALIFSPHPDDEVIIGSLPLRLLRQSNWKVVDLAVTLGSNQDRRSGRLEELQDCCDYIGFELMSAAANGLNEVNCQSRQEKLQRWAESVAVVGKKLIELNPKVIFFPHQSDWNITHIGTHFLVLDALRSLPETFSCYTVETEYWAPMERPNLMVEISEKDLGDLVTALSFHVGEVKRNPYHLSLPAWMIDNVRRGSELLSWQGAYAADFTFATLYRLRKWANGDLQELFAGGKILGKEENPASLFEG